MDWMSPKDLNDDPKRFLDTPHEMHRSLLELQENLFPGFKDKLVEHKVHCLQCEGKEPFEVIIKDTFEPTSCDGYIGEPGNIEFLHTIAVGGE